jgi:hypothetical protein
MTEVLGFNQRNILAFVAVTILLIGTYVLVPHPVTQYGAWLVIFTIWMGWFISVVIEWLSDSDI